MALLGLVLLVSTSHVAPLSHMQPTLLIRAQPPVCCLRTVHGWHIASGGARLYFQPRSLVLLWLVPGPITLVYLLVAITVPVSLYVTWSLQQQSSHNHPPDYHQGISSDFQSYQWPFRGRSPSSTDSRPAADLSASIRPLKFTMRVRT